MSANGVPPAEHLGDEGLSAALDERADARQLAHLAACEECQASLAAWSAAQAAWQVAPEPAASAQVETAVRAALAHARTVRPARARSRAHDGAPASGGRRGWRLIATRRRWMLPAMAAALVVVVLGVGVGLLGRSHPSPTATFGSSSASAPAHRPSPKAPEHGPENMGPEISNGSGATESLGVISSKGTLLRVLRERVARSEQEQARLVSGGTCIAEARRAARASAAATPLYVASLRYQGTPAHAAVFKVGAAHVAAVTADNGCTVLATATL